MVEKIIRPCEATDGGFDGAMARMVEHELPECHHGGTGQFCGCGFNWAYTVHAPVQVLGGGCHECILSNILHGLEAMDLGVHSPAILIEAMRRDDRLHRFLVACRDLAIKIGSHPVLGGPGPLLEAELINELILYHFQ